MVSKTKDFNCGMSKLVTLNMIFNGNINLVSILDLRDNSNKIKVKYEGITLNDL